MKLVMLVLFSALLGVSPLRAHEGHDHGDGARAVAPAASATARFSARTDVFELVGVLAAGELWIYLDRADNNAPVDQAEVELESGGYKARAERSAPAVYRLKAGPLATAGRHAVTLSVSAGDDADLLVVRFDNTPAAPAVTAAATEVRRPWLVGGALLLAVIAGGAWFIRRRRN